MKLKVIAGAIGLIAALLISGCGGSGSAGSSTPKTHGSAKLTIKWPVVKHTGNKTSLLIPNESTVIELAYAPAGVSTPQELTVKRPTTTANLTDLTPGDYTVTATAYVGLDTSNKPVGTAQSTATVNVRIVAGATVQFTIDMASTVDQMVWDNPTGALVLTTPINGDGTGSSNINVPSGVVISADAIFSSSSQTGQVAVGASNVKQVTASGGVTVLNQHPVDDLDGKGNPIQTRVRMQLSVADSGTVMVSYVDNDNLARVFTLGVTALKNFAAGSPSVAFTAATGQVVNDIDTAPKAGGAGTYSYSAGDLLVLLNDGLATSHDVVKDATATSTLYTGTSNVLTVGGVGRLGSRFGSSVAATSVFDFATKANAATGLTAVQDLTSDGASYFALDSGTVKSSLAGFTNVAAGASTLVGLSSMGSATATTIPWTSVGTLTGATAGGTFVRSIQGATWPAATALGTLTGTVVAIATDEAQFPTVTQTTGLTYALTKVGTAYSLTILSSGGSVLSTIALTEPSCKRLRVYNGVVYVAYTSGTGLDTVDKINVTAS